MAGLPSEAAASSLCSWITFSELIWLGLSRTTKSVSHSAALPRRADGWPAQHSGLNLPGDWVQRRETIPVGWSSHRSSSDGQEKSQSPSQTLPSPAMRTCNPLGEEAFQGSYSRVLLPSEIWSRGQRGKDPLCIFFCLIKEQTKKRKSHIHSVKY